MLERLIENWLDNASEKTFQLPFCYMLANEGYTILHLTRHCGMEHGKDIIAVDPDGYTCAFQLKGAPGSKIKLRQWQSTLVGQVQQMIFTPVSHPSATSQDHHRSFLVTNGEIEEEVLTAIDLMNRDWKSKGQSQYELRTYVRGQLVTMAKKLGESFIPPEIRDYKSLLEFYLEDGSGTLDKDKFSALIESFFSQKLKPSERQRLIASSGLLVTLATSNFSNRQNHVAIIEAWVIYISYLLWYCSKYKIPKNKWNNEYCIANQIIWTSCENILADVKESKHFLVGNIMEDAFLYKARITWIVGFLCSLGLYYSISEREKREVAYILKFVLDNESKFDLWGESAIPNLLCFYWLYRINDATQKPTGILVKLIRSIVKFARNRDSIFPEPYYGIEESISLHFEKDKEKVREKNQKGVSYFLEGITHLFVKENYKQMMKALWPDISRVFFKEFEFKSNLDFFKWRNGEGKEIMRTPKPIKEWDELKRESFESRGEIVPDLLKQNPHLVPIFLVVFPHRSNPSFLRWFDNYITAL